MKPVGSTAEDGVKVLSTSPSKLPAEVSSAPGPPALSSSKHEDLVMFIGTSLRMQLHVPLFIMQTAFSYECFSSPSFFLMQ